MTHDEPRGELAAALAAQELMTLALASKDRRIASLEARRDALAAQLALMAVDLEAARAEASQARREALAAGAATCPADDRPFLTDWLREVLPDSEPAAAYAARILRDAEGSGSPLFSVSPDDTKDGRLHSAYLSEFHGMDATAWAVKGNA